MREVTIARDVALVIERHILLVERLGLDGVHLTDGVRSVRKARKALGDDAIVGTYCAASRHDGMTAGEMGADYVSFGPVGDTPLGDGTTAGREIFEWWSEMIEGPGRRRGRARSRSRGQPRPGHRLLCHRRRDLARRRSRGRLVRASRAVAGRLTAPLR